MGICHWDRRSKSYAYFFFNKAREVYMAVDKSTERFVRQNGFYPTHESWVKAHYKTLDLKVGDVIMSPRFKFCYKDTKGMLCATEQDPDPRIGDYTDTRYLGSEERVKIAIQTGIDPGNYVKSNVGVIDESRGNARFVVILSELKRHEGVYAPYIEAKRLNHDGSYNPSGEIICFHAGEMISALNIVTDITIVGRLNQIFV